jgi:LPXTG-motif cell wall-anchored protein
MKKLIVALAGGLLAALALSAPAPAATTTNIPVESKCNKGWYVNPDEAALLPVQVATGFLFDGPSIVHRATNHTLANTPTDGSFSATVHQGVKPLFKMETTNPYSTINKTADGKYWSSKIASGLGSQSTPVNTPGDLVGKWNYTAATKTYSFGVGYANDTGNKATVGSIKFAGLTYPLTCRWQFPQPTKTAVTIKPNPTVTATATASPSPSVSTSTSASTSPSASPTAVAADVPELPKTGSPMLAVAGVGGLLVAAGVIGMVAGRRRKVRVEP